MKPIRVIPLVALLLVGAAPAAQAAASPATHQLCTPLQPVTLRHLPAAERGVLVADEYQVPVEEGFQPPENPAAEEATDNVQRVAPVEGAEPEQPAPVENPAPVQQPPPQE